MHIEHKCALPLRLFTFQALKHLLDRFSVPCGSVGPYGAWSWIQQTHLSTFKQGDYHLMRNAQSRVNAVSCTWYSNKQRVEKKLHLLLFSNFEMSAGYLVESFGRKAVWSAVEHRRESSLLTMRGCVSDPLVVGTL